MKILIIGQAPPAIKQTVPYDSTMLYDMLKWAGVTKESAQSIFEFEAISNKFPGFDLKGGHLKPSKQDCDSHWNNTLELKLQSTNRVILLGLEAAKYIESKEKTWSCTTQFLRLIHPSKRNFSKIMSDKEQITNKLTNFLNP